MSVALSNEVLVLVILGSVVCSLLLYCLLFLRNKTSKAVFARSVLDNTIKQICLLDDEGLFIHCNKNWEQFIQSVCCYTNAQPQKSLRSLFDLICQFDPKGSSEILKGFSELVAGKTDEFRSRYTVSFINETRQLEIRFKRLSKNRLILFQIDRTDNWIDENRYRAAIREADAMAMQLETNQRSLEMAIQGGRIGIWHWDVATGYLELSQDWYRLMGCPELALEASIESFRSLLHDDDKPQWSLEKIKAMPRSESFDCVFRVRRSDGKYVWVQALGSVNQYRQDGLPESVSGVLIDIDDRKKAELKDVSMARIIEDSLNEVYVIDAETLLFLEVNRGARENLGYNLEELRSMSPRQTTGGDKKELQCRILDLVGGKTDRIECEIVHVRKDGSTYPFLLTLQMAEYEQREVFVAIGTDLTKRNALESKLRQAQKLKSIGELSAGVAHEINTPLQCVGMNVQFLSETTKRVLGTLEEVNASLAQVESSEDTKIIKQTLSELLGNSETTLACHEIPQAIEDSSEAIGRVLKIIRAMKELSHPGEDKMVSCDLKHLIESTVAVAQNHWKNHAVLVMDLCPQLMPIECDPGTLSQVFVNLLVNASDAIEAQQTEEALTELGTITIKTKNLGNYIVIEVTDTGCGMNQETAKRIFDPFFTTKKIGAGTGQGMALCQQIITQQHRGNISVHSKLGEGTRIRIKIAAKIADRPQLEKSVKIDRSMSEAKRSEQLETFAY